MIHRAILGSLERFIAIITEHFGGKWCVFFRVFSNACVLRWAFRNAQAVLVVASPSARDSGRRPLCESCARSRIIPQQLTRTPFGACVRMQKEYAQEIADKLTALGLFADVDNGADTLPKKIRNGEIAQYNFLLGMFFFPCALSFGGSHPTCHVMSFSVVGQEELDNRSVNVRNRDDVGTKAKGEMVPLDEVTARLVALKHSRHLENKLI